MNTIQKFAWVSLLIKRNEIMLSAINNSHSFQEKISFCSEGFEVEWVIGGYENGVIQTFVLSLSSPHESLERNIKDFIEEYEKYRNNIPKNTDKPFLITSNFPKRISPNA